MSVGRVPDSRASNDKCPTSIGTEPVPWKVTVEQRPHDYWQNVAVDDRQRRILMCSGPSGTEELCCAGIST